MNSDGVIDIFINQIVRGESVYLRHCLTNVVTEIRKEFSRNMWDFPSSCLQLAYIKSLIIPHVRSYVDFEISRQIPLKDQTPLFDTLPTQVFSDITSVLHSIVHVKVVERPTLEDLSRKAPLELADIFNRTLSPHTKKTYTSDELSDLTKRCIKLTYQATDQLSRDILERVHKSILNLATSIPEATKLLGGWKADRAHPFYPRYLLNLMERVEDFNSIQLFEAICNTFKEIPGLGEILKKFMSSLESLPMNEQAIQVREWLRQNPECLKLIIRLDLSCTKMNKLPEEINQLDNLTYIKLSSGLDSKDIKHIMCPHSITKILHLGLAELPNSAKFGLPDGLKDLHDVDADADAAKAHDHASKANHHDTSDDDQAEKIG